ncbi:LysR substrate-binding domain-containing protein [Kordiimonas marina]|uniref:LysR substrate-binding domain-containing protein n=1 Tax=Kordiimonas marina TaxID=2872312 RepID=UPI001FF39249|nr:LysR substrate-binding domain-containing protein [Kordiimonas marina]MCJ9429538.1 LysR family transcriptional regulator [Kordiimonas marina]
MNDKIMKLIQASPFLAALYTERTFTGAAKKLHVHQTAVSHRIRALEDILGVTICERTTRSIQFTRAGELLCEAAYKSIEDLTATLSTIITSRRTPAIRLSTSPSMAMKWLVPLLADAKSSGLDLTVQAQTLPVDLIRGEADVALRFGPGPYPGLRAIRLSHPYMVALASPAYIARKGIDPKDPWRQELDILMDVRAETEMSGFGWSVMAEHDPRFTQSLDSVTTFDRTDLAMLAAINGLGVTLGRTFLMEDDINNGFLVPLGLPVPLNASDWLLASYEFAATEKFKALAAWVQAQTARTLAMSPVTETPA